MTLYQHLSVVVLASILSVPVAFGRSKEKDIVNGLPNIKSAAALVIDLKTNEVLFERDADTPRPIASISKLMGAIVVMKHCNLKPEEMHTMTVANREAAKGGDKSKLITGWSYSHHDLLKAALMKSDNRALPALAEACGMDPAAFGVKMTEEAKALGLTQTKFVEPDGLSRENQSTPREVMTFLREAIKIPELSEIMNTRDSTITGFRNGRSRVVAIRNTDRLLSRDIASILGGKTGYTDIARYCLAVAARIDDNRELGMVFLGAEGKLTRFADFSRVIRWIGIPKAYADEAPQPSKESPTKGVEVKTTIETIEGPNGQATPAEGSSDKAIIGKGGASAKPQELFEYYW